ncbi:MAG: hypothetical protein ABR514_03120 [Chthoniobacterales bacterium]
MDEREASGKRERLLGESLFWIGAEFYAVLCVAALALHARLGPPQHATMAVVISNDVLSGDPGEGALTLERYDNFDFAQHLDWHSQEAISAEALLIAPEESIPVASQQLRRREPRISVITERGSGRIPDVLGD